MGTIIITGVPGVGKTTVVEKAAALAGVEVVTYGTQMLRVAVDEGLVKDRDEMRRLAPEVQRQLQERAAMAIAARGRVIVDTHGTIATPKGYLPGIPVWVAEALQPSMIVLVEADAAVISGRRANDASRRRDEDSVEAIERHQHMNRAAAMAVAVQTGATVLIVQNEEGKPDAAAERIAAACR